MRILITPFWITINHLGGQQMVEKKDIEEIFSEELSWITNKKLKEQVVEVWKTAADRGKWSTFDKVPFTLLFENSGKLTENRRYQFRLSYCRGSSS